MLGDTIAQALTAIGITENRVQKLLGGCGGCAERREKLNQLGWWAKRVLSGKVNDAKRHLQRILGSETEGEGAVSTEDPLRLLPTPPQRAQKER